MKNLMKKRLKKYVIETPFHPMDIIYDMAVLGVNIHLKVLKK